MIFSSSYTCLFTKNVQQKFTSERVFPKPLTQYFLYHKTFLAVSIKLLQLTSIKLVDRGKSESDTFWLKNARRWERSLYICRYKNKNVAQSDKQNLRQRCLKQTHGQSKYGWILSSASQHVDVSTFRGSRQGVWTLSCAASPIWQRWPSRWWSGGRRVACARGPCTSCTHWLGSSRSSGKGQHCNWFGCGGEVKRRM